MWNSRTIGPHTFTTLVLRFLSVLFVQSGLFAGGKDSKEGRQTVFFTAADPMNEPQRDEPDGVKEPRVVPYRTLWEVYQNAVQWINLKSAQNRGLTSSQTGSNAIIFDDSLPADCLEKVVHRETGDVVVSKDSFIATSATDGYF